MSVPQSGSLLIRVFLVAIALSSPTASANAQVGDLGQQRQAMAEALFESSRQTTSLEIFGNEIVRRVLESAAARIGTTQGDVMTIEVPFTIRLIPMPRPPAPDVPRPPTNPEDIDICWEISSSLQDYIDCSAPSFPGSIPPLPIKTCASLWADFVAATDIYVKISIFFELVDFGCVDPAAARLEVPRPR